MQSAKSVSVLEAASCVYHQQESLTITLVMRHEEALATKP